MASSLGDDDPTGRAWEYAFGHGPEKTYVAGSRPLTELRLEHWLKLKPMDVNFWWMRVGDARIHVFVEDSGVTVRVNVVVYPDSRNGCGDWGDVGLLLHRVEVDGAHGLPVASVAGPAARRSSLGRPVHDLPFG